MLLFAATFVVGCGKSASDKEDAADDVDKNAFSESRVTKLADKYAEGKFTEKDYKEAIDIYKAYNEDLFDKAESLVKTVKSREEFDRKMSRFVRKYAYVEELSPVFQDSEYEMGPENYEYLRKVKEKFEERDERLFEKISALPVEAFPSHSCDSDSAVYPEVTVAEEQDYYPAADSAI